MMALVEHDPRRRVGPAARGIDHHQRMVGDDQVGLAPGALGPLDEAFAVMRAAGIDALAAAVGQRRRPGPAEQARQPAGQVAADHVAVLGIGRPPPDEVRQHRRAPGEPALHRVLEVEQAQVILAPLADDDPAACARPRRGTASRALAVELALQRLGEGRHPHRARRRARPTARPARDRRASCRSRCPPRPAACWARPALARGANTAAASRAIARCPCARLAPGAGQLVEPRLAVRRAGSTRSAAAAARRSPPMRSAARTASARRAPAWPGARQPTAPSPSRAATATG